MTRAWTFLLVHSAYTPRRTQRFLARRVWRALDRIEQTWTK